MSWPSWRRARTRYVRSRASGIGGDVAGVHFANIGARMVLNTGFDEADAARLDDALRERLLAIPEAIMDRVFAARHDPARVRAPIPASCVAESTAFDFRRYFCRGFLGVAGCNW
jgi:hypothetical protein